MKFEQSFQVYWHTVIIGLACIPTSLILPACIHRLGAKFFIIFSLFIAGGVTFGLYFVTSSWGNLVLSCIFEALTSLGISTIYCVMVDLFPTNLRVMAAALSLTFGRGGALLGNLLFGFLIDLNCVVPIVIFSALLFCKFFEASFELKLKYFFLAGSQRNFVLFPPINGSGSSGLIKITSNINFM